MAAAAAASLRVGTLEEDFAALKQKIEDAARRVARLAKRSMQILEALEDQHKPEAPPQFWPSGACDNASCFRRVFVMPCHRSCPEGDFPLDGLVQGRLDLVARCITASMFISFGIRRNVDFRVSLYDRQGADQPRTVIINGGQVKHLRPDERGLGALLQRRLRRNPKPTQHRQVGFEALINKAKSKKCMVGITAVDMGLLDSIRGAVLNSVRGDGGGGGDGSGGGGSRSAADDGGGAHADRKRCLVLVLDEAAPMIDDPAAGWLPLATNGNGVVVLLGDNRGLNAEEEQGLEILETDGLVQVVKVSLGSIPLLASQCIVLVNHYLDKLAHCCPRQHLNGFLTDGQDGAKGSTPIAFRGQQCVDESQYVGWGAGSSK